MYKPNPIFANQLVLINKPGMPKTILISNSTPQEHLKILYQLGHPGVIYEDNKKK